MLIARAAQRLGRRVRSASPDALRALVAHPWPGNVRQLENALEHGVLMCRGQEIQLEDLPPEVRSFSAQPPLSDEELSIKRRIAALERELISTALARTAGNRSAAARLLEISYKALVYKIRDYGIES